jgi:ABC-2 type transport system ATP-binding protein
MSDAIVIKNVTKTFGKNIAVRNFDLRVPQGALYGIIGPNGAGKTTMIRMILSILFPDSGDLSVLGVSSALQAKDRIGYLPEERGLYKKMQVKEFLAYMAHLKGMESGDISAQIRNWLGRVDLSGVADKRCEELSKGMQQKIQFITAVIHRPDLLILDEPFSGLDPVNQRMMRDLVLEEHQRGATVLFSTHIMTHAELLCDHIVMIHLGDKVIDGTLAAIHQSYDPRHILFEPLDASADIELLRSVPGVQDIVREGSAWDIVLEAQANPSTVIPCLVNTVIPAHIQVRRPSLEDIFISIVSGGGTAKDEYAKLRAVLRGESGHEEARS